MSSPFQHRRAIRTATASIVALLAVSAGAQPRAIRATGFVAPDGTIKTNARIVFENGAITQIDADPPADAKVEDYGTAVVCPGLIDIHAALGAFGQLGETQTALQPDASAADAFDPHHAQFRAAMQAGVTTVALLPDERNLIGGRIALVRTSGAGGVAALWDVAGPMRLSLSPAVYDPAREPTSRSGALGLLRDTLARAAQAGESADDNLKQFATGRVGGIITVPTGADVLAALALADELNLRLTLVHQDDPRSVSAEVSRAAAGVIVGPFDFSTRPRQSQAAGLFQRAGAKVAIAGNLPAAQLDSLRVGAAVAARDGLAPAAARQAITSVPAELLGLGERTGSIAPGRAADLVVFSGDPLDLRSRVLAVYVSGVRVYAAPAE